MKELTQEERKREADELGRELDAIREDVKAYQIATFGRLMTEEEYDQFWEEDRTERLEKYKGLSIQEYLAMKEREKEEMKKELLEMGEDPEILEWKHDPDDSY